MSQISKLYQDTLFRKEVYKDLTEPQRRAYLKPHKAKRKRTGRKPITVDHSHCEISVRPCGPHQGLYCREHGTWIKWISRKDLAKIQDLIHDGK